MQNTTNDNVFDHYGIRLRGASTVVAETSMIGLAPFGGSYGSGGIHYDGPGGGLFLQDSSIANNGIGLFNKGLTTPGSTIALTGPVINGGFTIRNSTLAENHVSYAPRLRTGAIDLRSLTER